MRAPYSQLRALGAAADNPVILGRKFCSGCGRWRQVCDFDRLRRRVGFGLRAHCHTCHLRDQRQYRVHQTAEQRERRREYRRIYEEAKRRRAGIAPRQYRRPTVVDHIEHVGLPVEPLLQELSVYDLGTQERIVRRAGLSARALYRYRHGEVRHVRIDLADRIAVALGVPLALIYGDSPAVPIHARPRSAA